MVDIHSHILPMIDDGSKSLEESIAMLRMAEKCNVRHIVASSHGNIYPYSLERYGEAFLKLQEEIGRHDIGVKIYPGMEVFLDDRALELLAHRELLTINDTNYILAEVPFDSDLEYVTEYVGRVKKMGYRVIMAHPERYYFLHKEPAKAWQIVADGCALQINYGSLVGVFGANCQRCAESLIDMGLVHIIATDAHDTNMRSYDFGELIPYLQRMYSPEEIRLWLSENPSRVIKGMELLTSDEVKYN